MKYVKGFLLFIGIFVVTLAVGFFIGGADLTLYKFFAPKMEGARRQVFEQTKSYRQGMVQELQAMRVRYFAAPSEHRAALASVILHQAADFDKEAMPPDLRAFIDSLSSPTSYSKEKGRF